MLETFQVTGYRGYNDSGEQGLSFQQNATLMALQDEGGKFPEKPSLQLGKGANLGDVHSMAFSPDGKILASCNQCGEIRLWEPFEKSQERKMK